MAASGSSCSSGEPKTVAEEAAFAYKDIDAVMAASASLVRPTAADAAGRRQGLVMLTVGLRPAVSSFATLWRRPASARRASPTRSP